MASRNRIAAAACAAVAFAACAAAGPAEADMSFERLEYLDGVMAEAPQVLTVLASGHARYETHTNERAPDRPEIGVYETMLPAATVRALAALLLHPPFASLADHSGRIPSGDGYRFVAVTDDGETVEKKVGPDEPVGAGLRKVLDSLDRIVADVRQHPARVLRLALADPAVDADGVLRATVELSNPGPQPIAVADPAGLAAAGDGWLVLHCWADRPDADVMATVRPSSVAAPPGAAVEGGRLRIAPGGVLPVAVVATVGVERRRGHVCRASLASFRDAGGEPPLMRGEVLSRPVPLRPS